jgi:hypothetical protein
MNLPPTAPLRILLIPLAAHATRTASSRRPISSKTRSSSAISSAPTASSPMSNPRSPPTNRPRSAPSRALFDNRNSARPARNSPASSQETEKPTDPESRTFRNQPGDDLRHGQPLLPGRPPRRGPQGVPRGHPPLPALPPRPHQPRLPLHLQEQTDEALPMLQKAVELGENSARVYGLLGYCHLQRKKRRRRRERLPPGLPARSQLPRLETRPRPVAHGAGKTPKPPT